MIIVVIHPLQLWILSLEQSERGARLILATELPSTAWLLFSTSWGNDSMWAAVLLGWDHCQCQSWFAAHCCGLQSCNTKIHHCRAEWHLPDDIKQLRAILTGFLGAPLCRGKSWETETKGQYLCHPMLVTKSEVAFLKQNTPRTLHQWWWRPALALAGGTLMISVSITSLQAATGTAWCLQTAPFFLRISCCSSSYV